MAADWRTLDLIRQRVALIPGVELAAVSAGAGGGRFETGDGGVAAEIQRTYVTAGYFAAHGIPLVRGRAIGTEDEYRGSVAAVVNEAAAARPPTESCATSCATDSRWRDSASPSASR